MKKVFVSTNGRDEIREASNILEKREMSQCYIEANQDILLEKYGEKEIVAVTCEDSTEIAAVYEPSSENNWKQALAAIKETYDNEAYHSCVARRLKRED